MIAENEKVKISVRNLDFYYGNLHALKGNTIDIVEKSVTAFIGPSGCGKSTHIRAYNRMYELYKGHRATGEILMDGENVLDESVDVIELRMKIGMVFQHPTPFPMSIYDNVAYGLRLKGNMDKGRLDARVEDALKRAALWEEVRDHLGKSASALSGGQQQRLCIARCIAPEPEIILMDEPCSALDPVATLKIEELIDELKLNYTIVIVTHNMQQAARVSDYTGFFYLGELIEFDRTDLIFTRPAQKKTEDYITGRFG